MRGLCAAAHWPNNLAKVSNVCSDASKIYVCAVCLKVIYVNFKLFS